MTISFPPHIKSTQCATKTNTVVEKTKHGVVVVEVKSKTGRKSSK